MMAGGALPNFSGGYVKLPDGRIMDARRAASLGLNGTPTPLPSSLNNGPPADPIGAITGALTAPSSTSIGKSGNILDLSNWLKPGGGSQSGALPEVSMGQDLSNLGGALGLNAPMFPRHDAPALAALPAVQVPTATTARDAGLPDPMNAPTAAFPGPNAPIARPTDMPVPVLPPTQVIRDPGPSGAMPMRMPTRRAPAATGNEAYAGALPNPNAMEGTPEKPMDVKPDIDRATAGALPLTPHDPDMLDRIGAALGIRDAGPSYRGSRLDAMFNNKNAMTLLRGGLGTMAAAGKPGATAFGALGEGNLEALDARAKDETDDANRKWEGYKFGVEQSGKGEDRALEVAKYLTSTDQKNRELTQSQQKLGIDALTAQNTADFHTGELANTAQANAIRGAQLDINKQNLSAQQQNMLDDNYNSTFNSYVSSAKSGTNASLDALLDPGAADKLRGDAESRAADQYPQSSGGQAYAQKMVAKYQAGIAAAQAKGDTAAVQRGMQQLRAIAQKYYPDVSVNSLARGK